ncbi:hypothetical protein [Leptospira meyeri]|uniref:hypothetical protein n=1 Tax=Leptospira meyeri TaxID=29508 RepID=UPI000C2B4034|nr:hypothetical protein [Leptospira meyeri]PJZ79234.1 hypothetical protein CH359_18860 [Leptospira meyeri]PJZ95068.1 hypothetical protein CH358_18820 [Leptospira meyeri]
MSIFETIDTLNQFYDSILKSPEFDQVNLLADRILDVRENIESQLITNSTYTINSQNYINSVKNTIDASLSTFSSYKAGQRLSIAQNQITNFSEKIKTLCDNYLITIETFLDRLEKNKFSKSNNFNELYKVCQDIRKNKENIKNYKNGLEDSLLILRHYSIDENEQNISLAFYPTDDSLSLHIETAQMLVSIYECICEITNISTRQYPLKLQSHYSGSDNFILSGNPSVIDSLSKIILAGGEFFKENYTASGEFNKLSRQFTETENQLKIIENLKSIGIEINETKEILEKNLYLIACALNRNLINQYKVSVNEVEINIYPQNTKALPFTPKKLTGTLFDEHA